MNAFSALVAWDGGSIDGGTALAMLRPLGFRSFDTRATRSVPGAEVAVAVRSVEARDTANDCIYVDQDRRWLAFGDVRLYDRPALCRSTGAMPECSNLELVTRAFAVSGDIGLSNIHGDFSIVIWDWGNRTVHAIRDHFGLRPLLYRVLPHGLAIASDVRPLIGLGGASQPDHLDPRMVLDFVLGDLSHHGLTFFREIRQVWPGHRLVARQSGTQHARYWSPSLETLEQLTYPEMIREWRRLLERAVECRLESKFPIASYLSGGLDSGSIVGAAHRFYERQPVGLPPMFTLSALCPGLSCDETDLIRDAARASPLFHSVTWDASEPNPSDLTSPHPVMPGLLQGILYGPRHELGQVVSHGIRVVLAGQGGDEIGWSYGYFRDLVSRGRILRLFEELSQLNSWQGAFRHLRMGMRGIWASQVPKSVPGWAGKLLKNEFESRSPDVTAHSLEFDSFSQRETWRLATFPAPSLVMDASRVVLNDSGAELRLPYWDLRLVEFVLRIPWHLRAPHGDLRRVQRDAVGVFLSPAVRENRVKVLAGPAVSHQLRATFRQLSSLVEGSEWTLSEYIDQAGARRTLRILEQGDPTIRSPRAWVPIWRIAFLEAWNRARLNYHRHGRMMMHQVNEDSSESPPNGPASGNGAVYEAPKLTLVGNARTLLAANSGSFMDPNPLADGQGSPTG